MILISMGSFINTAGLMFVVYYGQIIAVLDSTGAIIERNQNFPMYLVEYLLSIPDPRNVRLN